MQTLQLKMPEEMPVTPQEEALARAMCAANGNDPDHVEKFYQPSRPNWAYFLRDARNAIAARKFFTPQEGT